jgi:DNA-binding MarR family transcriptional regulator
MRREREEVSITEVSSVAGDLRVVLGQLSRRLREQSGWLDLTRSQLSVLIRLEKDGAATMTALARSEGVRSQSMSAIVSALESAGLVRGEPDPNDGRKTVLSLTDAAKEQFATRRLAKEDWLSGAMRTELSPAEVEEIAAALRLLRRLANSA